MELKDLLIAGIFSASGGGGGYTAEQIINGEAPAGEVVYTADRDMPKGAITNKSAITKLTLDMGTYKFKDVGGTSFAISSNNIPVYVILYNNNNALPGYVFERNTSEFIIVLRGANVPNLGGNSFRENSGLTHFDVTFTKSGRWIGGSVVFMSCSKLETLIIRSENLVSLGDTNCFTGTPFASGGTGGTIYVPSALIASYQAANNWSTILGYANNQIKAIEGSIYENAYADGTPIA